jgi:SNF2 family DNA or RNA helicase
MTTQELVPLWEGFEAFPHQVVGMEWMLEKERVGTQCPQRMGGLADKCVYGGFQCDEMGLGKTIQMLGTMKNNPKPLTLLMAPLAMLDTWMEVSQKAGMRVYEAVKGVWREVENEKERDRQRDMRTFFGGKKEAVEEKAGVYITNYEQLLFHPKLMRTTHWDRIVLDEAHKIRNGDGTLSLLARKLTGDIRWALTGTPLVNSRKDVVSLLGFLGVPVSPLWKWESRLESLLPKILIHRTLEEVRAVVPGAPPVPIVENVILPFKTGKEEEFYRGIQGAIASKMKMYERDMLTSQQKFLLLIRLRQISVHPQVYINAKRREDAEYGHEDWSGDATKVSALKKILEADAEVEGTDSDHRYLVFCQFLDEMELVKEALESEAKPYSVEMYHGGLSQKERRQVLERAKKTERCVLLVQLQSGGVGLNLQEFDRCIFMSPWWTSAMINQAIARCVRMGQKKVVKVSFLKLKEEESLNIDTMIAEKAEEKTVMLQKIFEWGCAPTRR